MICSNCGTEAAPGAGPCCRQCGFVLLAAAAEPAPDFDVATTHPARFAMAHADARYAAAMAHDPGRGVAALDLVWPLVMIACGAGFFTFFMDGAPRDMQIFGGLFMVAWFGGLGFVGGRELLVAIAPLERVVAVVVDKRTEVTRSARFGKSRTHYATLEREDGAVREHRVSREVADLMARDAIGVAFLRRRVIHFAPLVD